MNIFEKQQRLRSRQRRVRLRILGTSSRPRLSVFRSNAHIYAQIIDDSVGRTLVAASSCDPGLKSKLKSGSNVEAAKVVGDALAERAKAISVEATLAREITQALSIPTIGIGAGRDTDGQVLVLQDMLGLYPRPSPKFSRNFIDGAGSLEAAIKAYVEAVRTGTVPGSGHSF